jgi:hypothetical protein
MHLPKHKVFSIAITKNPVLAFFINEFFKVKYFAAGWHIHTKDCPVSLHNAEKPEGGGRAGSCRCAWP